MGLLTLCTTLTATGYPYICPVSPAAHPKTSLSSGLDASWRSYLALTCLPIRPAVLPLESEDLKSTVLRTWSLQTRLLAIVPYDVGPVDKKGLKSHMQRSAAQSCFMQINRTRLAAHPLTSLTPCNLFKACSSRTMPSSGATAKLPL